MAKIISHLLFGCLFACGCAHRHLELQVYGDDHHEPVRVALEEFAQDRGLKLLRPLAPPASLRSEVAVVYGGSQLARSTARDLFHLLQTIGADVDMMRSRLQNHIVSGNKIAVFVRNPVTGSGDGFDDESEISDFHCEVGEDQAVLLMYDDGRLEVQSYRWQGEELTGREYHGRWSREKGLTLLYPNGLDQIAVQVIERCDFSDLSGSDECFRNFAWVSGNSISLLKGCAFIDEAHSNRVGERG